MMSPIRPAPPSLPRFSTGSGTSIALVVVVFSIGSAWGWLDHRRQIVLALTSAVYVAWATLGLAWAQRVASRKAIDGSLGALVALGAGILAASAGRSTLAVMPAVSMVLIFRSTRAAVVVVALYGGEFVLCRVGAGDAAPVVARDFGAFASAAAFVVVFSRLLLREQLARARVEGLAREVEVANAQLLAYASKVEDLAMIKERNRIARDIHDGLGHHLTIVHMQLEAARALAEKDAAQSLACVVKAQAQVKEGLNEVRRSVAVLRDTAAPARPLPEAISSLVDDCRSTGIGATLVIRGEPRALAPQVYATLFRAAQEALTNVRRHARASATEIVVSYLPASVELSVADDGVGADAAAGGFGLVGIRERVQVLGGAVDVRTAVGNGFVLSVRVPS